MKEATGDLWTYPAQWRVITTNGSVKNNGSCVMGRGCALEAKEKYPKLPFELGARIAEWGNHVHRFELYRLLTFPVKHEWFDVASVDLIRRSLWELVASVEDVDVKDEGTILMPRPGCGNGRLTWKGIRPYCFEALDDRFIVICKPWEVDLVEKVVSRAE